MTSQKHFDGLIDNEITEVLLETQATCVYNDKRTV